MLVLVGCEESGVVRRAFAARGHEAWSNDLEPARDGDPHHLQMDVMDAIGMAPWDLIILHPVCQFMCLSGNKHYGRGMPKHHLRVFALQWTAKLWNKARARAYKGVAMENPTSVLWGHLGVKPQYVQPYQFGHTEQKKTGLALDRLPPLKETNNVYEQMMLLPKNVRERCFYMAPSETRSRDRSETYAGIADAMADQWGNL